MARFDKFIAEKNAPPQTNGHSSVAKDESSESPRPKQEISPPTSDHGHKRTSDDDELSDVPISPSPKKKRKVEHFVDADAAYAAKLQAEENCRARPTRGGASRKSTTIKKKKRSPKKKTSDKVKAEDDSDLQDSGSEAVEKKVNRSGGFHVRCSWIVWNKLIDTGVETHDPVCPAFRPFGQRNSSTSINTIISSPIRSSNIFLFPPP